MIIVKNQFVQHVLTAVTLVLVLGALSMIWPMIIAIFFGILRLLQSFSTEPEIARLSWTDVEHVSIVINALRRPGLPAMFS